MTLYFPKSGRGIPDHPQGLFPHRVGASALQFVPTVFAVWWTHREVGVGGGNLELSQHFDSIGQFKWLVQHVLALHVALGDGEDVAVPQLLWNGVCTITKEHAVTVRRHWPEKLCCRQTGPMRRLLMEEERTLPPSQKSLCGYSLQLKKELCCQTKSPNVAIQPIMVKERTWLPSPAYQHCAEHQWWHTALRWWWGSPSRRPGTPSCPSPHLPWTVHAWALWRWSRTHQCCSWSPPAGEKRHTAISLHARENSRGHTYKKQQLL